MGYERYYKAAFTLGWIANLALWILVVYVLIKTLLAPVEAPFGVAFSFAAFSLLFVLFSIALGVHIKTRSYVSLILTILFMVGQFICVLVTTITIFADERIHEKITFSDAPVAWIQSHRWLPILFSVVFLPLFAIQIYVINRHAQSHKTLTTNGTDDAADYQRKATPYHSQQKDYMPADTVE